LRASSITATTWDAGPALQRSVADYIAGMTDRFAAREHQRLTGQRLLANDT
jgi:dGTPase